MATSRISYGDIYGFKMLEENDKKKYEKFLDEYLPILTRRAARWHKVFTDVDSIRRTRKMKRFCRKGIPHDMRSVAWMNLSGAKDRMLTNPHIYQQMLSEQHSFDLKESITIDINRTFPENVFFKNSENTVGNLQKSLCNILLAIGQRNQSIGYCQGMNFVAGMLLVALKDTENCEENVFWLMDTLINNILPGYYMPDMHAVKVDLEMLGEIVKWKYPDVSQHFHNLDVPWCLVGMKWFICLFADVLPVETVLRIWDCLFCEGAKVIIRAAVVLIHSNREKILKCTNFFEVTQLFQALVTSEGLFLSNDLASISLEDCIGSADNQTCFTKLLMHRVETIFFQLFLSAAASA